MLSGHELSTLRYAYEGTNYTEELFILRYRLMKHYMTFHLHEPTLDHPLQLYPKYPKHHDTPSIPNTTMPTKARGAETLGAASLAPPVEVEVDLGAVVAVAVSGIIGVGG